MAVAPVGSLEIPPELPAQRFAQATDLAIGAGDIFPVGEVDDELWDFPSFIEVNDTDLFLDENRRLWNFEVYRDRHEKPRLRRTLRFVYDPPCQDELGVVTEAHAAALEGRRGRGRWSSSREDARVLRPLALTIARYHRRNKGRRKRG